MRFPEIAEIQTNLADVLRLLPQLCKPDDALFVALASTSCRDALHELYPLQHAGVHPITRLPMVFRFRTTIKACVISEKRLRWSRAQLRNMPWPPRDLLVAAARSGNLAVCELLFPEAPPLAAGDTSRPPAEVCRAAASGGHTHVLEWAHAKGYKWDASLCSAAAHFGDLSTIVWLKQRGCPWDKATTSRAECEGHTAVLNWVGHHVQSPVPLAPPPLPLIQ